MHKATIEYKVQQTIVQDKNMTTKSNWQKYCCKNAAYIVF